MLKPLKTALIGGTIGVAAPILIALANEVIYTYTRTGDVVNAKICFAERHWEFLYPRVRHATGCKNSIIDSVPLFMLLFAGGGAALSIYSSRSKSRSELPSSATKANYSENQKSAVFLKTRGKDGLDKVRTNLSEVTIKGKNLITNTLRDFPADEIKEKVSKKIDDFPVEEIKKNIKTKANQLQIFIISQEIPNNIKGLRKGQRPNMATTILLIVSGGFVVLLLANNFGGQKWDDKSINKQTLNDICTSGLQANAMLNKRFYIKSIFQARVALGNSTAGDYNRVRNWMLKNCPDGW